MKSLRLTVKPWLDLMSTKYPYLDQLCNDAGYAKADWRTAVARFPAYAGTRPHWFVREIILKNHTGTVLVLTLHSLGAIFYEDHVDVSATVGLRYKFVPQHKVDSDNEVEAVEEYLTIINTAGPTFLNVRLPADTFSISYGVEQITNAICDLILDNVHIAIGYVTMSTYVISSAMDRLRKDIRGYAEIQINKSTMHGL